MGARECQKCPCCNFPSETMHHQLHYSDPDRVQLFMEDCALLLRKLQDLGISSLLAKCLLHYLKGRGDFPFQDIPFLPEVWVAFAREQDQIDWDNFLIGMVGCKLHNIIHFQLMCSESLSSVDDWLCALIDGLLHITHRQWLYRNAVVHSLMHDGLEREEQ